MRPQNMSIKRRKAKINKKLRPISRFIKIKKKKPGTILIIHIKTTVYPPCIPAILN